MTKIPALATNNISFQYGSQKALDGVSLQVPVGEFVALLGANGAGKTTFFSIISGLYAAKQGSVSVLGNDIRENTLKALGSMGVVFQKPTVDTDLSVIQNLRYAASLQGIRTKLAKQVIGTAIEKHALTDFAKQKVGALSGGQRRRVELARALLHKPALLLLDEPTVGLDAQSRHEFVEHVKELCRTQNTGVLWATHLMDEISANDLVYILNKGRLIEKGSMESLTTKYAVSDMDAVFRQVTNPISS